MFNVVVAHSSEEVAEALAAPLRAARYAVTVAVGAEAALAQVRERRPDVLLAPADLDALLDRVKRDAEAFRTAVVLLESEELTPAVAGDRLRRGAQDFLLEPLRPAELVARVQAAGRTKILQQELDDQTRRFEAQLFQDPLTGLFNRRYLFGQLAALMSGARRHARPIAVAMLDLDGFKAVNDAHGHEAGDRVLVATAEALRGSLRAEDVLGRVGGDELVALLPDTDAEAAAATAERMRAAVAEATAEQGVSASVGWAVMMGDESADDLVRRADDALYAAKRDGRNRVRGPATLPRRT